MQVRKVRRRFLPILLSVALLPISAIVTASTAQAVGTALANSQNYRLFLL